MSQKIQYEKPSYIFKKPFLLMGNVYLNSVELVNAIADNKSYKLMEILFQSGEMLDFWETYTSVDETLCKENRRAFKEIYNRMWCWPTEFVWKKTLMTKVMYLIEPQIKDVLVVIDNEIQVMPEFEVVAEYAQDGFWHIKKDIGYTGKKHYTYLTTMLMEEVWTARGLAVSEKEFKRAAKKWCKNFWSQGAEKGFECVLENCIKVIASGRAYIDPNETQTLYTTLAEFAEDFYQKLNACLKENSYADVVTLVRNLFTVEKGKFLLEEWNELREREDLVKTLEALKLEWEKYEEIAKEYPLSTEEEQKNKMQWGKREQENACVAFYYTYHENSESIDYQQNFENLQKLLEEREKGYSSMSYYASVLSYTELCEKLFAFANQINGKVLFDEGAVDFYVPQKKEWIKWAQEEAAYVERTKEQIERFRCENKNQILAYEVNAETVCAACAPVNGYERNVKECIQLLKAKKRAGSLSLSKKEAEEIVEAFYYNIINNMIEKETSLKVFKEYIGWLMDFIGIFDINHQLQQLGNTQLRRIGTYYLNEVDAEQVNTHKAGKIKKELEIICKTGEFSIESLRIIAEDEIKFYELNGVECGLGVDTDIYTEPEAKDEENAYTKPEVEEEENVYNEPKAEEEENAYTESEPELEKQEHTETKSNKEKAQEYYELANAYFAKRYRKGNIEKAADFMKKAAVLGNIQAIGKLADVAYECYIRNQYEKAAELAKEAIKYGDMKGNCVYGTLLVFGHGVEKDKKQAFELFKQAADQNYGAGLHNMAYCYYEGCGVEKDKTKAAEYYAKAYELGYEKKAKPNWFFMLPKEE